MPLPLSEEKKHEWQERIQQQRASGLSIERWCRDNQVQPHTFYYWRDQLFPKVALERSSFKELADSGTDAIAIECHSFRIYLDRYFNVSYLKRCLEA